MMSEDLSNKEKVQLICKLLKKKGRKIFGNELRYHNQKVHGTQKGIVFGERRLPPRRVVYQEAEPCLLIGSPQETVNVLAPTIVVAERPMFVYDDTGDLWSKTASTQKAFEQNMGDEAEILFSTEWVPIKIQPLCTDGSASRWNPFLEIRLGTKYEWEDTESLLRFMMDFPEGSVGGDPFWQDCALEFMEGLVLHLLYKAWKDEHYRGVYGDDRKKAPVPTPKMLLDILSMPDITPVLEEMRDYAHISLDDFFGGDYLSPETFKDEPWKFYCPLEAAYGEYIKDFSWFSEELGVQISSLEELRMAYRMQEEPGDYLWMNEVPDADEPPEYRKPWRHMLTHPKAYEAATAMLNMSDLLRHHVIQMAKAALHVYQNPIIQKNTEASDFWMDDYLQMDGMVTTVYFLADHSKGGEALANLFLSTLLHKMTTGDKDWKMWQEPLLLLDDFPAMGRVSNLLKAMQESSKAGYKICLTCRSIEEVQTVYQDEASILQSCRMVGCFAPEAGNAKTVSYIKGKLSYGEDLTDYDLEQKLQGRMLVLEQGRKPWFVKQSTFEDDLDIHLRMGYPPPSKSVVKALRYDGNSLLYMIFEKASQIWSKSEKERMDSEAEAQGLTEKEYCQTEWDKKEKKQQEFEEAVLREEAKLEEELAANQAEHPVSPVSVEEDEYNDPPLSPEVRDRVREKIGDMIKADLKEVADPIQLKAMKLEFIKRFLKQKKL